MRPISSMKSTSIKIFLTVYALLATVSSINGGDICHYGKRHRYFSADCSEKKLTKVPENLKSDIEVLDLSYNMIRELYNNSFSCCTSIELLYLAGNSIYEVESHTFYYLSSLQVLDFNTNVLEEIPKNLPSSLHRLYLNENPTLFRRNAASPLLKISSLTSLEVLTLSSNKLEKFPKFDGFIPNLIKLNVTFNPFKVITPEDLAPLCLLRYLHVSGDKLFTDREHQCTCHQFQNWTKDFNIILDSEVTCKKEQLTESCVLESKNETLMIRGKCLEEQSARKLPYKLMIGSGIVALIVCICILLYIRHRRRQREKSKTAGGQNSRTPSVKYDDHKTLEEKCTNHAFDYRTGRTRPPGGSVETTV